MVVLCFRMPEIGEVMIIADNVASFIKDQVLIRVDALHTKYHKIEQVNDQLPQTVTGVSTHGKTSWLELENGICLKYGLGMTGNFRPTPTPELLAKRGETAEQYLKHAHIRLVYLGPEGESELYYHDVRRLGLWHLLTKSELDREIAKMGVDLVSNELTDTEILARLRHYNHLNVCKLLMDQHKALSGVGNYLKAEALYHAQIYPYACIKDLDDTTLLSMYHYVRNLARAAYEQGGASLYTFTGIAGDKSDFKFSLKVYGRKVDPLGHPVNKIKDLESPDRRTTHWVPAVQNKGRPQLRTGGPKLCLKPRATPVPSFNVKLRLKPTT